MWEDEGSWNAYDTGDYTWGSDAQSYDYSGGSYDWGGSDWYNDGANNYSSNDYYSDPGYGGGWQQNYDAPSTYQAPSGGGSWQQNYDFEPRYVPGSTWNPSALQMTSGVKSGEELAARLGTHQAAQDYRKYPGFENNPYLRDAEHILAMEQLTKHPLMSGPIQRATLAAAPAVYAGGKYVAQNMPAWLQQYLPNFLTQASPPSWNEVWSGTKAALR